MRSLSGARVWEYAYEKALEDQLDVLRKEVAKGATGNYQFLCGKIDGIDLAIKELKDARLKSNLDDDADFRE